MTKKTKKIKKILIANRGEIACRVMKTARKMGIATVAVYSDADRKALHVRMADEAVHIGPSPAIESYLVINKIIDAAKQTGADAIHPGYGFLSENPDFVRACQKAKITFIGPAPESMEAMGLKDAAKKLMDAAGVPITPGYHGKDQSPKLLKAKAGMIGYPVLIKAVAGGGGKGMRKVETEKEFDAMLASCQREAKSSFNNDDVLIEKYIQSPRHIEVQVFGDTHGNVVHMFERDCSLQRRHQKVIEEAPAPGMTKDVRKAMTDAAIEAAKAVNYVGAGTVEFIVDGSGKLKTDGFWFMEMNTRLQVEHPVTEMITGLDLVELQIRVAQGEKLSKQKDIKMEGHAIEARLYAEDPANDFLPSVGKLALFDIGIESVRVDTGVAQGDTVSVFYDPMIAKIISYSSDRETAIRSLQEQLNNTAIWPIKNNSIYLSNVIGNKHFTSGKMSTHTLADIHENSISRYETTDLDIALYIERWVSGRRSFPDDAPFQQLDGWRLNGPTRYSFSKIVDGIEIQALIIPRSPVASIEINGKLYCDTQQSYEEISTFKGEAIDLVGYLKNSRSFGLKCDHLMLIGGKVIQVENYGGDSIANTTNALTAPMPGKIIAVNAKIGDTVKAGDPLIIMEAMKMEMTLDAPRDGIVAEMTATPDALVTDGEMLLSLEEDK